MPGIKPNTQREFPLNLIAGQTKTFTEFDNTRPNVIQIHNYNGVDAVYVSTKGNVSPTFFDISVVAGGTQVLTYPKGVNSIYLYCASSCLAEMWTYEADGLTPIDLNQTQTSVIINSTTTSSVIVTSEPPIPAGTNVIGKVGFDATSSIPAGNNVIGHVVVDSMPTTAMTNTGIGNTNDAQNTDATSAWSLVSLLKGIWTKLGNLTIGSALPAGSNKIGSVDIAASTPIIQPATTPTIYNLTLTSANTEYSQALPANTKRVKFSIIGGDNSSNYRYAYVTGKVATPTSPYYQYNSDVENEMCELNITGGTLYFACSVAGKVVQMEVWN